MSIRSSLERLDQCTGLRLGALARAAAAVAAALVLSGGALAQDAFDPMDPRNPRPENDHGSILLDDFFGDDAAEDALEGQPATAPIDGEAPGDAAAGSVNVSEFMTVDIFVRDEDLGNVLQMLSLQSRRNIIASKDVSASVTANLYGVTIDEALDAILNVNGYGWIEQGNFIYVYPAEVIAEMQAAERKLARKVIRLNYLKATDAALFIEPLLSEAGTITVSGDVTEFAVRDANPQGAEDYALAATLVIFDYPEHIQEIEALVQELDQRPAQILVEATILQTQLTEANAFGVDFSIITDMDFVDFFNFGGPLGAADALSQLGDNQVFPLDSNGGAITSRPGNFAGPATLKFGLIQDDIALFVRALDEVTDLTVLSNPKILTLNRQAARVLVGRKIGYLNTTSTQTSTTQSVEFLDTGTQLSVRPFVSTDGMIRMELAPRVSEGLIREATDATGAAVTIPDEITQEVTTNVMVPDGATIVLGGLFREQTRLTRRQVPVFGDIPLIGNAFRGFDDSTERAEIIFLITPSIVSDKRLIDEGELAIGHMERVRTGSRSALLPWSRDRQTSSLNVEAQRLADDGESDKALWTIRRSLELNPNQPEAIRLREQLTGERRIYPHRSYLRSTMHEELRERQQLAFERESNESRQRNAASTAAPMAPTIAQTKPVQAQQPASTPQAEASAIASRDLEQDSERVNHSSWSPDQRLTWHDEQARKQNFPSFADSAHLHTVEPLDAEPSEPMVVAETEEASTPDAIDYEAGMNAVVEVMFGLIGSLTGGESEPAAPTVVDVPVMDRE